MRFLECLQSTGKILHGNNRSMESLDGGGVVRREGDEIRLVAVLDQVVFRCVRIVLFGTVLLN